MRKGQITRYCRKSTYQGLERTSERPFHRSSQDRPMLTFRQLGGYARHRHAFKMGSWQGLIDEVCLLQARDGWHPAHSCRLRWTLPGFRHVISHETTGSSRLMPAMPDTRTLTCHSSLISPRYLSGSSVIRLSAKGAATRCFCGKRPSRSVWTSLQQESSGRCSLARDRVR